MWDSPRMSHVVVNAARPETREQRAWYWYDWANSAYVTTTATVLIEPLPHHRRHRRGLPRAARRRGLPDDPLRPRHPRRAGVAVVLHRHLHDDPLGDRPHLHRRHRRPQSAPDRSCWAGSRGPGPWPPASVPRQRHQLAAGRRARRRRQHLPRRLARHLRLDAVRIANGTSATASPRRAGRSATSAVASCSRSTSPSTSSTTGLGLDRALSTRISMLSAGLWWAGVHDHPLPRAAPA